MALTLYRKIQAVYAGMLCIVVAWCAAYGITEVLAGVGVACVCGLVSVEREVRRQRRRR